MLHTYINNHHKATLSIMAALALITVFIQINTGRCLKTELTPGGILSLEFASNQTYAGKIRTEWQKECSVVQPLCMAPTPTHSIIEEALANIKWDFAFIIAYVSLLYVLVVLHENTFSKVKSKPYTLLFGTVCIMAGLLDGIENILMSEFLKGADVRSWIIAAFASAKFLGLAVVAVYLIKRGMYLMRFSAFTLLLVHLLWNNRVSVIGLLVLYFTLWKSDQGQDLLINLNASHWGPATFYVILTILATFYWYWPKYFSEEKWKNAPRVSFRNLFLGNWNPRSESLEAPYMPRLLGLLTFIIPACGILHALDAFEIPYVLDFIDPLPWLMISIVFYLVMMENHVFEKFFDNFPRIYYGVIIFLVILVGVLGLFNQYSPNDLGLLAIGLYALAFIFIMVTSVRNDPDFYKGTLLAELQRQKANAWMLTFVTGAALAFFVFNCYPYITADGPYRFMTLPVVLTGIVFYSFVFFLLMIWGKKKKINFAAFLIAFSIILAVVFDNKYHDVKVVDRETPDNLPSLNTYMHNWVVSRKDEIINRKSNYPVFIVNAYGGGIRAAAWTTMAVSFLDSITSQKFQDHVIAYSGASGGTIGASVLCAVRRNEKIDALRMQQVKTFYQNDFLTPVLIGLFGRDVWFSTLGISWAGDRSRLQDKLWERHTLPYAGAFYGKEFSALWYPDGIADYKIPLLFSNTYHIEKGLKGILAPVSLDTTQFESAVIVNNLLNKRSVLFSTGSFLSARFPILSPAGKIDNDHHFLDGGLKENSGAETAEEIYRAFLQLSDKVQRDTAIPSDFPVISTDTLKLLYSKLSFHFLSLNNSLPSDDAGPKRNLVELTAPFEALYNNWVGNTMKADSILRIRHAKTFIELRPVPTCVEKKFKPVLPLGWQISDGALTGMHQSLTISCRKNLRNLRCIESIIKGDTLITDCKTFALPCND
jgi:hypothetical protein